jgi:hypothetical protein
MPELDNLNPNRPNLCSSLRWKGLFYTASERDPDVQSSNSGYFWCLHATSRNAVATRAKSRWLDERITQQSHCTAMAALFLSITGRARLSFTLDVYEIPRNVTTKKRRAGRKLV